MYDVCDVCRHSVTDLCWFCTKKWNGCLSLVPETKTLSCLYVIWSKYHQHDQATYMLEYLQCDEKILTG